MLLRRVPSGSGPGPPDGEDLPSSGPEYISRARLLKGSPPRIRLPITAQLLSKIRSALDGSLLFSESDCNILRHSYDIMKTAISVPCNGVQRYVTNSRQRCNTLVLHFLC